MQKAVMSKLFDINELQIMVNSSPHAISFNINNNFFKFKNF